MGTRERVLRDFLGFPQRLQAPGPDSWAAPTGETREPRALTPCEGCVQGPRLHGTSFLQPAENRPWSESWLSSVGGVQWERSWQQWGRKDPSPSCPYSGHGGDITQLPRASSRLRHGHSAGGSLWPASFVETGRCRGSGKGGGAAGRLLCPLCIACPGSSGLAVASSKAPGFCLVIGKSEPKPLSPSREDLRRGRKRSSGFSRPAARASSYSRL